MSDQEAKRLHALRGYNILDTISEQEYDRITELAALICDVPMSLVSLVEEDRQWFKSRVGITVSELPAETSFCKHTIRQDTLLEIPDMTKDARFADNEMVTGEMGVRFYAGQPLIDADGYALGSLCVIDRKAKKLNSRQKKALALLGSQVTDLIMERREKQEFRNFYHLFQSSNDLIGILNEHNILEKVNPAFKNTLGFAESAFMTIPLLEFIDESFREAVADCLLKLRRAEKTATFSAYVRTLSGEKKYLEFVATYEAGTEKVFIIARDITEEKTQEIHLTRTREMLERTNQVARVGGWELDLVAGTMYWSSVTKDIHAVSPDFTPDLTAGINFYKEGESRDKIREVVNRALENFEPFDLELQIVTARGEDVWVRAIGHVGVEKGKAVRLYGTFQDINARKKVDMALSTARKVLDEVLDAAEEVSVIATGLDGTIRVFNKGAEKMLGYTAEEVIGRAKPAMFHDPKEIDARSRELSEEYGYAVSQDELFTLKAIHGDAEHREWAFIRKDGKRLTVSLVISAMRDVNGDINGFLGIASDITKRKKVEDALVTEKARLSSFIQYAPVALAMFDTEMRYIAVSNRWLDDYRLAGRQIIGQSHMAIFPQIKQEAIDRYMRCMQGEVYRNDEELIQIFADEPPRYISREMRPWYQYDGKIGGILISAQNITPIIEQREQLKKAKTMAEQASIAKSEFLANMSHEIRTPLNGVIGFTDLVLKTNLSETQQQYLSIVNQSGNALLSIINDILDFSKIEAGKLELDVQRCDLLDICSQSSDIISYQVQTKGLEMLLDLDVRLPRFARVDEVRLKQILVNLLSNAAKFTEKGEILLKADVLDQEANQTRIRFAVKDSGIGIQPEKQEKIFEAFSQEDSSTTKRYGGTGLGLTISNKLLAMMNSRMQLTSVPGEGSTFFFDIALETENDEMQDAQTLTSVKKILLVDDNDNNRQILRRMLELKSLECTEAKNGIDALQRLDAGEKFDVIIMDYNMPYLDGLETSRKIRNMKEAGGASQNIVLLYSSSADARIMAGCQELDIRYRMPKPLRSADVMNILLKIDRNEQHTEQVAVAAAECPGTEQAIDILIVEDNPVNMLLAKTIMKRIAPKARIFEAANGIEAISHVKTCMPDLIFMDVQMPEMNGYEATRHIRSLRNGASVPIIALTAGNIKGEKEHCLSAGMSDFVSKPVVEDTLALMLRKWFDLRSGAQKLPEREAIQTALHFDRDTIMSYVDHNEELFQEIVQLTMEQLKRSIPELDRLIARQDLKNICALGHKIYGTAITSGLHTLSEVTNELEHLAAYDEQNIGRLRQKYAAEVHLVLEAMGELVESC